MYGFMRAIVSPASFAIIADNYDTEQRGKIAALTNAGFFVGFALGAVVGIGLSDFAPFELAVVTSMTFSALAAFVAMRYLKEPSAKAPAKSFNPFAGWPMRVLLAPQLVMWGVIVLTISLGINLLTPVIGPYAREHLQLDLYQFVPFLVPAALLGLLSIIPAGHLSDRLGRYQPLLGGLSIGAVALIVASFAASAWVLMFIAIPVMLAYTISVPAVSAVMMDISQRGSRGVVLGALTAVQGVGGTIGPPIGGHAFDAFGPTVPFQLAAVMLGAAVVMGMYYSRWRASAHSLNDSATA
jgi:MFS family permease